MRKYEIINISKVMQLVKGHIDEGLLGELLYPVFLNESIVGSNLQRAMSEASKEKGLTIYEMLRAKQAAERVYL